MIDVVLRTGILVYTVDRDRNRTVRQYGKIFLAGDSRAADEEAKHIIELRSNEFFVFFRSKNVIKLYGISVGYNIKGHPNRIKTLPVGNAVQQTITRQRGV